MTDCTCIYHRYTAVHICPCGQIISHSQDDWNLHKIHIKDAALGTYETFYSDTHHHGDTPEMLRARDTQESAGGE